MWTSGVKSRWICCFSLAAFQAMVGLTVASLAIAHIILVRIVQDGNTPHVDSCHDSTIAAVLQGTTLVLSGLCGCIAYGRTLTGKDGPRFIFVVNHVMFSAVVSFVGYNAATSRGCFALGRGGEKPIFGMIVARVVLSYLCHIIGALCTGLSMPDVYLGLFKKQAKQQYAVTTPNEEVYQPSTKDVESSDLLNNVVDDRANSKLIRTV